MTIRSIALVALALGAAAPLAGQGMDHTTNIQGSGKLPAGWNARFDQASSTLTQVDVRQAGTALAFRSGPAAIYWNTRDVATGPYTVSAIFEQKKSMQHEAYGIFVGGQNLVLALVIVLVVSTVSSLYPAWIATRVSPREAMQSEE